MTDETGGKNRAGRINNTLEIIDLNVVDDINQIGQNNINDPADETDEPGNMYEISEAYGIIEAKRSAKQKRSAKLNGKRHKPGVFRIVRRVMLVLVTFVVVTFVGAYSTLWVVCHGTSKAARNLFVSTILETGALQFLATWYFTEEEILAITEENSMAQISEEVNTGMISVQPSGTVQEESGSGTEDGGSDADGASDEIQIVEIAGRSFLAKLMIVRDPSRVRLATIYPWSDDEQSKRGKTLGELVTEGGYLAGVNGGEYYSDGNWGGKPKGLVVCGGQIQYNVPQKGDVMAGFNEDDILVIKDIGNMTAAQVEEMVEKERIRDAVTFKDEKGDSNHFTKLIINGKAREISGNGSGANPRTAIGQREDGAVLLLVTDGRGASGHLGATAADLIAIMQEYGAVNAANLDGGSSSAMYYDGAYEMTSVTLYYSTSSWKLPTAYVVERRGE